MPAVLKAAAITALRLCKLYVSLHFMFKYNCYENRGSIIVLFRCDRLCRRSRDLSIACSSARCSCDYIQTCACDWNNSLDKLVLHCKSMFRCDEQVGRLVSSSSSKSSRMRNAW
jgi:hypothetical protein